MANRTIPAGTLAAIFSAAFFAAPAGAYEAPPPQGEAEARAAPTAPEAAGQQPSLPRFEEKIEVVEVLLDVLVTSRDGSVIVGLGPDDFVVEEDGRPRKVESAAFYSNRVFRGRPGESGAAAGAAALAPDDRYFVFFFFRPPPAIHPDPLLYSRLPAAGRDAFQWVAQELLPNDFVAVVSFEGHLKLVHDFTQDRERLGWAIAQASTGRTPKRRWPSRAETSLPGLSLASLGPEEELRVETSDLFRAVARLGEALGGVRGRKVLVLFGVDFPPQGSAATREGYRAMVEALNESNVAAYAIEVTGRGRKPTPERLAYDTGGDYAVAFARFLAPLAELERQNGGYYLLSFRGEHPAGESGYQRVRVRTANPEFEVRARSGYRYGD